MARLVAGLAHELNNTLQVVSGLVELLADRSDLPPDAVARLQKIGGQADKATTAIRQVLGYTRRDGQRFRRRRYHPRGRSGARAPPISAGTIRHRGQRRSAADRECQVRGDERQLAQALLNLVMNAEEALSDHAERRLRIAAGSGRERNSGARGRHRPRCRAGDSHADLRAVLHDPQCPIVRSVWGCR